MDRRAIANNVVVAFSAQGIAMCLSVIQALLVPKVLDVEQFGYWQLFVFYQSYVGLFQLGLSEGVYLLEGGTPRTLISKSLIKAQFLFGATFEIGFGAIIVVIAVFGGFGAERGLVIACMGIFIPIKNASSYIMNTCQAMNETKRSSCATIVERMSFLVPLVVLIASARNSFEPYVYSYLLSSVIQLFYCLWHFKDFLQVDFNGWDVATHEGIRSIGIGIKLMLANTASLLILGVSRLIIDFFWGVEVFGELSLAISLVSFFLAFVNQVSMVLFPALRQSSEGELRKFYIFARDLLCYFAPVVYLLYFPIASALCLWLPDYSNSFAFFAYLIPVCVFDSRMNVACMTYFKVQREESRLLWINLATAAISAVGGLIGAFLVCSVYGVICSAVVAVIGRSIFSDLIISQAMGVKQASASVGEIIITGIYITVVILLPALSAFALLAGAYLIYLLIYRREIRELVCK